MCKLQQWQKNRKIFPMSAVCLTKAMLIPTDATFSKLQLLMLREQGSTNDEETAWASRHRFGHSASAGAQHQLQPAVTLLWDITAHLKRWLRQFLILPMNHYMVPPLATIKATCNHLSHSTSIPENLLEHCSAMLILTRFVGKLRISLSAFTKVQYRNYTPEKAWYFSYTASPFFTFPLETGMIASIAT